MTTTTDQTSVAMRREIDRLNAVADAKNDGGRRTSCSDKLPAVECEPWCTEGDGHTDDWAPSDQMCTGEVHEVFLTRYPLVKMSDDTQRMTWAEAQLCRKWEGRPYVAVMMPEEDTAMTPDEAIELGRILIELGETAKVVATLQAYSTH